MKWIKKVRIMKEDLPFQISRTKSFPSKNKGFSGRSWNRLKSRSARCIQTKPFPLTTSKSFRKSPNCSSTLPTPTAMRPIWMPSSSLKSMGKMRAFLARPRSWSPMIERSKALRCLKALLLLKNKPLHRQWNPCLSISARETSTFSGT